MSKETLISIIIPTFNRGHLILDTLNSVKNQSYKHWECLVVDDGSTDGTESLLQDYILKDNRFKYYDRPNTHRSGGNGARNFGVKQSQGELLVFLDSDDVLSETALENRISRFDFDTMDLLISHTGTFKSDVGDSDRIWNKVDSKSSTNLICRPRLLSNLIRFNLVSNSRLFSTCFLLILVCNLSAIHAGSD